MSASDDIIRRDAKVYDHEGRTRIPKGVREAAGFKEGDNIEMIAVGGQIHVVKVENGD
jgi:AbrB family looped-hinge helix DNA binding protein